jgi:hypothetical protein
MTLLPYFLGDIGLMWLSGMEQFSVLQTVLSPYSLLGTGGCPSGDRDGGLMDPHFYLQPRRPNKSSQGEKYHKQNENAKAVSSISITVLS